MELEGTFSNGANKPKILLVEDNPLTIKLVKLTLETDGYQVVFCESGNEALLKLENFKPDLILQDIRLPDIDGFVLIKQIRSLIKCENIPIIAFSGSNSLLDENKIKESGFTDFLLKPVEPSVLLKCIKRLLLEYSSQGHTKQNVALIIDDDPLQLKFTGLQFNHAGFEVIYAIDGKDGLEKAQLQHIDVIVSDVLMPKLDGFQLCKALRAIPELNAIPIILVSANYVEESDRRLAEAVGANGYVYRSLGIQEIIDTVTSCINLTSPPLPLTATSDIDKEIQARMQQQLERQVSLNIASRYRHTVQNTILGQIGTIADALLQFNDNPFVLDDILARCIDIAGLTQGVFYYSHPPNLKVRAQFGFANNLEVVDNCFNQQTALTAIMENEKPIAIPSNTISVEVCQDILEKSESHSALLLPVRNSKNMMGLFIIFAKDKMLIEEDWLVFGQNVASKFSQATELSDTFSRLVDSEQRFRQLADNIREAFFLLEPADTKILYISSAFETIWGTSIADIIKDPNSMLNSIIPEDQHVFFEMRKALHDTGQCKVEFRIMHPSGLIKWILIRGVPIYNDDEKMIRVAGTAEDITERKNIETHIKSLNRLYALLSGINSLIVRVNNRKELLTEACKVAVEMGQFDYASIGLINNTNHTLELITQHSLEAVNSKAGTLWPILSQDIFSQSEIINTIIKTKKPQWESSQQAPLECMMNHFSSNLQDIHSAIFLPLLNKEKVVGIALFLSKNNLDFNPVELKLLTDIANDISFALTVIKNKDTLNFLAYYDPLTRLYNRSSLLEQLNKKINESSISKECFGLILININKFRDINDTLGHQNGDILLNKIANRLVDISASQDIVACLGGDEFALLIPHLSDKTEIIKIVKKINTVLFKLFYIKEIPLHIEARIGVALFTCQGIDAETLWRHADVALTAAKKNKILFCQYDEEFDDYNPQNLALLGELRKAIEKEELVLHWQPKVDFKTKKTCAMEALIRWQHPTRGLIYPDDFIPFVEHTALIKPLTSWVISNAIKQAKKWYVNGYSLDVAINISVQNLQEKNIDKQILDQAAHENFPVEHIIIEITESAVMDNTEKAKLVLTKLRDAGIQIAIDDFGIGQSSLTYLKDLPITDMKIDKSFVMELDNPGNTAIVKSAFELAHSLHLSTTAEGVESEEIYLHLERLGCDVAQGYYISKPLPEKQLLEWLASTKWPCKKISNSISDININ